MRETTLEGDRIETEKEREGERREIPIFIYV